MQLQEIRYHILRYPCFTLFRVVVLQASVQQEPKLNGTDYATLTDEAKYVEGFVFYTFQRGSAVDVHATGTLSSSVKANATNEFGRGTY